MSFGDFVRRQHEAGTLVVQPRMGLPDPFLMRQGLVATNQAAATTVGTITLDSYTRVGDLESAARAVRDGLDLNGYPIITHGPHVTRDMIEDIGTDEFPIQVRHGSAKPVGIVDAMRRSGLNATEGGPVSYCLPYGRTGLDESLREWTRACRALIEVRSSSVEPHLETFGGCMMGQLCPPSLLIAISVLEALYFRSLGFRSVSVSYAQQTNAEQDREAISSLRKLCADLLPDVECHTVIYAYMGMYPRTASGARSLLANAARLAVVTGSERLIVKTVAEAHRLPTVAENVDALELAAAVAAGRMDTAATGSGYELGEVYHEAYALVDAVLNIGPDIGRALVTAVKRGLLDVPYCLHPDNAGRSRSYLDSDGRLRWAMLGAMPLRHLVSLPTEQQATAASLISALSYIQRTFDAAAIEGRGDAITMHRLTKDSQQ
ncbi:methylaspartate mutase [Amycolatopsis sp. NPDC054798]